MTTSRRRPSPEGTPLQNLTRAVNGVVTAKFNASLRTVRTTLILCDNNSLQRWALLKSCQIQPLLQLLLERSANEDDALQILARIISEPMIRRVLSVCEVELVQNAISELVKSSKNGQILTTCLLAFLKLQEEHFTPSYALVQLLNQVFHNSFDLSDSEWVLCVESVFSAITLEVLTLADESATAACWRKWKSLIRSEEHTIALQCLHVSAFIYKLNRGELAPPSHPPSSPAPLFQLQNAIALWVEKAHLLFRSSKASSVLHSTILRVIFFSSEGSSSTGDEAHYCLRMALRIIEVVDPRVIGQWQLSNQPVLQKLVQKAGRQDIRPSLQCLVFLMLRHFNLNGQENELKAIALKLLKSVIGSEPRLEFDDDIRPNILVDTILDCLSEATRKSDESSPRSSPEVSLFANLFRFILDQCQPARDPSSDTTSSRRWAMVIVLCLKKRLDNMLQRDMVLRLVQSVNQIGLPDWWPLDLASPQSPVNCGDLLKCPHRDEADRQTLGAAFTSLVLEMVSLSTQCLQRQYFNLLVRQMSQQSFGNYAYNCSYGSYQRKTELNVEDLEKLELDHDWQTTMSRQLTLFTKKTNRIIDEHVSTACHALQERCDNVEIPLRAAQQQVEKLNHELEQTRSELDELLASNQYLNKHRSIARDGRAFALQLTIQLRQKISSTHRQCQALAQQNQNLESELLITKDSYERQLYKAQFKALEDMNDVHLGHKAEMFALEDQLENLASEANKFKDDLSIVHGNWYETQLQLERAEQALVESEQRHLEEEANWKEQLTSVQSTIKIQDVKIMESETVTAKLQQIIASYEEQIERQKQSIVGLQQSEHDWSVKAQLYSEQLDQARSVESKIMSMLQLQTGGNAPHSANSINGPQNSSQIGPRTLPQNGFQDMDIASDDIHVTPLKC